MSCVKTKQQLNLDAVVEASVAPRRDAPHGLTESEAEGRRKGGHVMENLSGYTFDAWTVIEYAGSVGRGLSRWLCQCQCGVRRVISRRSVLGYARHFRSCGCCHVHRVSHGHTIGGVRSPEFVSWQDMIQRCHYEKDKEYRRYGGRGISVCDRWRRSFIDFLHDMGLKPTKRHTIDRINNYGGYEPLNCKWATQKEQQNNKRPRQSHREVNQPTGIGTPDKGNK